MPLLLNVMFFLIPLQVTAAFLKFGVTNKTITFFYPKQMFRSTNDSYQKEKINWWWLKRKIHRLKLCKSLEKCILKVFISKKCIVFVSLWNNLKWTTFLKSHCWKINTSIFQKYSLLLVSIELLNKNWVI